MNGSLIHHLQDAPHRVERVGRRLATRTGERARRELRITLREWHRRIPEYGIKPGHEELEWPPGLRHVKDLTLSW